MDIKRFALEPREARYYRALYQGAVPDQLFRDVLADKEEIAVLMKRSLYYRALYQAAMAMNSTRYDPEVLGTICENMTKAFGAKACSILLLSRDRRELIHSATHGLSDRYMRKGPVDVDRSIADALEGRSVAVKDACRDPRVQYGPQNVEEGIGSILSVPMRPRDEVIGVMRIYTSQLREFSSEDIEFVEAVANLGAIAIENATVHEALQEQYENLRHQKTPWAENFKKPGWRG